MELQTILQKRKKELLAVIGVLALLAAGTVGWLLYQAATDPYDGRIAEGISVGTVELAGLTKGEARAALNAAYGDYAKTDMVLSYPERELLLTPAATKASFNTAEAVKAAYAIGRSTEVPMENRKLRVSGFLGLDTAYIASVPEQYAAGFESVYQPSGAVAQGQTLLLSAGMPGYCLNTAEIVKALLDAYENHTFLVTVEGDSSTKEPEKLSLAQVEAEFLRGPQEPYVNKETLELVPGVPGQTFDTEAAASFLDTCTYGDLLTLKLEAIQPELQDEDGWFRDTLGYCETPHGNNQNRTVNLRVACAALDGLVLQPGEEFSYNDTLGPRTAEAGYKPAPAYSGTTLVDSLGGGICQVSSTLYLASTYAELTILERRNHGFPVSYIPLGMDATVNWGFSDLKMRNDSALPVKIHAEEADNMVKITILGTELRDYHVEMSYSAGGRHVRTYKSKVDNATGQVISKESYALSSYLEDVG